MEVLFKIVNPTPLCDPLDVGSLQVLLLYLLNFLHVLSRHFAHFPDQNFIPSLFLYQLILHFFHRFFKLLHLSLMPPLDIVNLELSLFPHVLNDLFVL